MTAIAPDAHAPSVPGQRLPDPLWHAPRLAWRGSILPGGERVVPEETAVAIAYNNATHAVMMATPDDLEDFAVGFSLTERLVAGLAEIEAVEIAAADGGIVARVRVPRASFARLDARRRALAGPVGCGLCGIESLAEALPVPLRVRSEAGFSPADLMAALHDLGEAQPLHRSTRAVHAAGFWRPGRGMVATREDLGRHNALDKLVGALARAGEDASGGIVVLTSRVSVELVQKAAVLGAPVLMAVSAPTGLAIRTAEAAGIALVAIARDDGFELFTCPDRIEGTRV